MRNVRHILPTACLALILLTAGCLSLVGNENVPISDTEAEVEEASPSTSPRTGSTPWNDTVSGTYAFWFWTTNDASRERVEIPRNATEFTLRVTTESGDLRIGVEPPECAGSSVSVGGGCVEYYKTEDGAGQWTVEDPQEGSWRFEATPNNPGYSSVQFHAVISWTASSPTSAAGE